jgi:hypothetical protein
MPIIGHNLVKVKGNGDEEADFLCTTVGNNEKERRNHIYFEE